MSYTVRSTPFTISEIEKLCSQPDYNRNVEISICVSVDLDDIIQENYEGFLDLLEEKILGKSRFCLSDIKYTVVGTQDGNILVRVDANIDSDECEQDELEVITTIV